MKTYLAAIALLCSSTAFAVDYTLPTDGWYQLQSQRGVTLFQTGDKGYFDANPNQTYILINHTTGVRNENFTVADSGPAVCPLDVAATLDYIYELPQRVYDRIDPLTGRDMGQGIDYRVSIDFNDTESGIILSDVFHCEHRAIIANDIPGQLLDIEAKQTLSADSGIASSKMSIVINTIYGSFEYDSDVQQFNVSPAQEQACQIMLLEQACYYPD